MNIKRFTRDDGKAFVFCTFRRPGKKTNIVASLVWQQGRDEQTIYFHIEDSAEPGRPNLDYPADVIHSWVQNINSIAIRDPSPGGSSASSDWPEAMTLKAVALCLHPWAESLIDKIQVRERMLNDGRAQCEYVQDLTREIQSELKGVGMEFDAATMATLGSQRYLKFAEEA